MKNIFGKFKMLFCIMLAALTVGAAGGCGSDDNKNTVVDPKVEEAANSTVGSIRLGTWQQYVHDFLGDEKIEKEMLGEKTYSKHLTDLCDVFSKMTIESCVMTGVDECQVTVAVKVLDFAKVVNKIVEDNFSIEIQKEADGVFEAVLGVFFGPEFENMTLKEALAASDDDEEKKKRIVCGFIIEYLNKYITEDFSDALTTNYRQFELVKNADGEWKVNGQKYDLEEYNVNTLKQDKYVFTFSLTDETESITA